MNCERCRKELEDFLYGELGESRDAAIRAHLGDCASCAALRDQIERENEIFTQFYERTSIEPAAEMWEAIRARINAESGAPARSETGAGWAGWLDRLRAGALGRLLAPATLRQAAFAALLVALSVTATTIFLKRGENGGKNTGIVTQVTPTTTPQQGVTPSPAPSNDIADGGKQTIVPPSQSGGPGVKPPAPPRQLTEQELMNRQIARAEREYQKAVGMLDQVIAKRRDRLDPEVIKQYESSLALIDDSIAASRRSMQERPGDPTAGQFLLAAYARKLDLMQDMAMR